MKRAFRSRDSSSLPMPPSPMRRRGSHALLVLLLVLLLVVTPMPQAAPLPSTSAPSTAPRPAVAAKAPAVRVAASGASAAGNTANTPKAAAAAPAAAPEAAGCPSLDAPTSAPGCPCRMRPPPEGDNNATMPAPALAACPAGYRCSPSAARAIARAGWGLPSGVSAADMPLDDTGGGDAGLFSGAAAGGGLLPAALATRGVCVPCQLGELCLAGSEEETPLSLAACRVSPFASAFQGGGGGNATSATGGAAGRQRQQTKQQQRQAAPGGGASAPGGSCSGFKACPAGHVCPTPARAEPCAPGRWCPEGSTASETCNISALLSWNVFRTVPSPPQALMQALAQARVPAAGNFCPANSSGPLGACPAGSYCPSPGRVVRCPAGFFCAAHAAAPRRCPPLALCRSEGQEKPGWSWLGLAFMLVLLALLLCLLEYLRCAGRSHGRAGGLEDELLQLIAAVGFQVVATAQEERRRFSVVRRAACARPEQRPRWWPHLGHRGRAAGSGGGGGGDGDDDGDDGAGAGDSDAASSAAPGGGRGRSGFGGALAARWRAMGMRLGSGGSGSQRGPVLPTTAPPPQPGTAAGPVGEGVEEGQGDNGANNGGNNTLGGTHSSPFATANSGGKQAHQKLAPLGSVGGGGGSVVGGKGAHLSIVPSEQQLQQHQQQHQQPQPAFAINPRLTLVYTDVWVTDRPTNGEARRALRHGADALRMRAALAFGGASKRAERENELKLTVGVRVCSRAAVAQHNARLAAAAADGARFIVPGVSGRFVHSQLHALMGPSGCGKTSLLKALAGRLPLSRVLGCVRVLASAADGGPHEPQLDVPTFGPGAPHQVREALGFVPQFDLLHESLTVEENLRSSAFLRLPRIAADAHDGAAGDKGPSSSASFLSRLASAPRDAARRRAARQREVAAVVDEVLALMALTKVRHQVVGRAEARKLSGGQRKRAAIGAELVSRPSLLFLDEPTSGLDAAVAADVIGALKQSAARGMNCVAVVHQPRCSVFDTFDTTTLLSAAGHVVFSGPQSLALRYFGFLGFAPPPGENAADFLLDVVAGVVPRPRDPDFIPSQLALMWERCGSTWVARQRCQIFLALQRSLVSEGNTARPPPPAVGTPAGGSTGGAAAAAAAPPPVTWPWRPRELEALLARFHLVGDATRDGVLARAAAADGMFTQGGAGTGALLRVSAGSSTGSGGPGASVLSYDGFRAFWEEAGLRDLLPEDEYEEFVQGLCDDFGIAEDVCITQRHFLAVLKAHLCRAAQAAAAAAGAAAAWGGGRGSVRVAGSTASGARAGAPAAADPAHILAGREGSLVAARQLSVGPDGLRQASAAALDEASPFEAAVAAVAASHAASAVGTIDEEEGEEGAHQPAPVAVAPGFLTCPTMRLHLMRGQQRESLLRRTRTLTTSDDDGGGGDGELPPVQAGGGFADHGAGAHSGGGAAAGGGAGAAAGAAAAAAAAAAAPRVHFAGDGAGGGGAGLPGSAGATPSLQPQQQQQPVLPGVDAAAVDAAVAARIGAGNDNDGGDQQVLGVPLPSGFVSRCRALATLASLVDDGAPAPPANLCPELYATTRVEEAPQAAAAIAARVRPTAWQQLAAVVARSARKETASRTALAMDLVLSAVLGLALGAAQGRASDPGDALMWLLITLLAWGCLSLVRAIATFGSERATYLGSEAPGGVRPAAWLWGRMAFDAVLHVAHPALFYAWMYVANLSPVPASTYFAVLLLTGFYAGGLGYLVSVLLDRHNSLVGGLGVGLMLGGVANGIAPRMWQMSRGNPLLWLDALSFTRWGLQAMYIDWLLPLASPAAAPATAALLSSLGFCGLDPALMASLEGGGGGGGGSSSNGSSSAAAALASAAAARGGGAAAWWRMSVDERARALAGAAADAHARAGTAESAAASAAAQLWQYVREPGLLEAQCRGPEMSGYLALFALGVLCRVALALVVRWKVTRKVEA